MNETEPTKAGEDDQGLIDRLAGRSGHLVAKNAVMRFVAGVIMRERERLAEICVAEGSPELAKRIVDPSMDANVFRFRPPSVHLRDSTTEPKGGSDDETFKVE